MLALCIALIVFAPDILRIWSNLTGVRVSSEVLTEEIRETGILLTLTAEETGEFVSEVPARVIRVAQRVSAPYRYCLSMGVDLSEATVTNDGGVVTLALPAAQIAAESFDITGKVKKFDFLYPLTQDRYNEILNEQKAKLREKYDTPENRAKAEEIATEKVRALLLEALGGGRDVTVEIATEGQEETCIP